MQPSLQRRRFIWGVAASGFCAAGPAFGAAEVSVPYFRSGRFQFTLLKPRMVLPSVALFPLRGTAINLQSLQGRPILLNFWASWCEACRIEMPVLDRLSHRTSSTGLQILAVSEDRAERTAVERFVVGLSLHDLAIYLDPNGYVAFSDTDNKRHAPFALYGMPITYAITASGWIVGYMPGAADWESVEAARLIEFLSSN